LCSLYIYIYIYIYIDGTLVVTNTAIFSSVAAAPTASDLCFGEDYAGGSTEFFNGKMDEIRVWTVARTAAEIMNNRNSCLVGNEVGLSAYYQCNGGQGNSVIEMINAVNGTMASGMPATGWVLNDGLLCNNSNFDEIQMQMTQTVTVTVTQPVTTTQTFNGCLGFSMMVGSNTYSTSGTYSDTLAAANACDSIITTNLTINQSVLTSQTLNECAGFSIMVGSNTYSTSGTYMDTLVAASSCDSIITTNLTVAAAIDANVALTGTTLMADQNGAT